MNRTRHKWAEIWQDGHYKIIKEPTGYRQMIGDSRSFMLSGPAFATKEECLDAAKKRMADFIKEKVIFA